MLDLTVKRAIPNVSCRVEALQCTCLPAAEATSIVPVKQSILVSTGSFDWVCIASGAGIVISLRAAANDSELGSRVAAADAAMSKKAAPGTRGLPPTCIPKP